jgi:glycosyltransferase involved in cell wall biosynthesis
MAEGALISVIMPSYNAEASIRQSLASALNQTYRNLEVIVVDDASTDATVAIVRQMQGLDSRVRLIRQARNAGAGAARNRAIHEAAGELLAFLDADDTWAANCLEKLHEGLESSVDAVLAYCGWQNLGLEPQCCPPYVPPDYEAGNKLEYFLKTCPWPIHAVLVRKAVIVELGGFDERWSSCMDFDLWLRLGWCRKVVRVPEVLAFYHHHDGNSRITRNRARVALNHWRIQKKFLDEHPELVARIGAERLDDLVDGELLYRAFEAYWKRDLATARILFRHLTRHARGRLPGWQYRWPSFLPERWHAGLIALLERWRGRTKLRAS